MTRFRSAALPLAACLLVLAACARPGQSSKPPEPGDVAVATVNGQTVWASDVKREAVTQGVIGEGEPLDVSSDLFHQVLDEVIDQKLLAAEALKRHLDSEAPAKRRLAAARERILGDMLVENVVEQAVNEDAIKNLYQEQLKLAKQSQEYHLRQIVSATEADAQAVKKLLASGASFEALAMDHSTDTATRFNGGDLGGYVTADAMPDTYAAALKGAATGAVVGPFKTDAGFVLVKVDDQRLEKPITIEEARPQIVRFLTYDEVRDLLEKLRGKNKVAMLIGPAQEGAGAPREPASAPSGAAPVAGSPAMAPPGPSVAEQAMHGPAAAAKLNAKPSAAATPAGKTKP